MPKRRTTADATAQSAPSFAEQTTPIDDSSGPLGIRLVTQREGERTTVRASGPTLLVPVHAGMADVATGAATHTLDRASWLLVPKGARAVVLARSPVVHTLVLTVTSVLRERVAAMYTGEIDPKRFERYLAEPQALPRTTWVNEVCHRYLFERAVCRKRDNVATSFLEAEIVKELYFVCHERFTARDRAPLVAAPSALIARATAIVDGHLFEPDVIERALRGCGASPSTLLRTFKRELGCGPLAYVRRRRLEESMLLLKARRYNVSEVAAMVGYRNLAAFSHAFRARFGVRPSEVRAEHDAVRGGG